MFCDIPISPMNDVSLVRKACHMALKTWIILKCTKTVCLAFEHLLLNYFIQNQ